MGGNTNIIKRPQLTFCPEAKIHLNEMAAASMPWPCDCDEDCEEGAERCLISVTHSSMDSKHSAGKHLSLLLH